MKLYRYEVVTSLCPPHTGILVALDYLYPKEEDTDIILRLCAFFEDNLPHPGYEIDVSNTMSFFTGKGNRKFNKAIKNIKKTFNVKRVKVVCIQTELDRVSPLYQDEYQVIIDRDAFDWEGSTTSLL